MFPNNHVCQSTIKSDEVMYGGNEGDYGII